MALTLVGGNDGIIVRGAYGVELYIKGLTDYYRLSCLYTPKTSDYDISRTYSSENIETQNLLEFILTPKVGEPGASFYPSELSYSELFSGDISSDFTGSEIYIKNNSSLHRYLINNEYDEYINVLQPFLYLGKLYPKDSATNTIIIETHFIKDFVLNALPEISRTDNLREFFGVSFDELYTQSYSKLKNILSLSDPYQTKTEYLHYLLEMYKTTSILSSGSVNFDLERFYINNLPSLLKRKGTYESIITIYKTLTGTSNRLNIYEQWHDHLPSSAPSGSSNIEEYCETNGYEFQEHLYTDYYPNYVPLTTGVGSRYYINPNPYPNWASGGSFILSPHYRVEIDLSTEPVDVGKIIGEETIDLIMSKFEEFRPVSKFATYSMVAGFKSDFAGNYIDTYDGKYPEYIKTRCIQPIYAPLIGCYIYTTSGVARTSADITHNLGTKNVLIQAYSYSSADATHTQFTPRNVYPKDENVIHIDVGEATVFSVLIISLVTPTPYGYYVINDFPLDTSTGATDPYPIEMIAKEDESTGYRYEVFPSTQYVTLSAGNEHAVGIPTSSSSYTYSEMSIPSTFTQIVSGSTSYSLMHGFGTQAIVVDVCSYDPSAGTLTKILPKRISIPDYLSLTVETYDTKPYIVLARKLTNWPYINTKDNLLDFISYIRLGNGTTTVYEPLTLEGPLESEIPLSDYTVKSIDIYRSGVDGYSTDNVKVVIEAKNDINIREVGIFGTSNEMFFYTKCSEIFVPKDVRITLYFILGGETQ